MLAAMLLSILVYWTDVKVAKKDENLWVWKSHEDFQEDLMFDKPGMKPPHRTTIKAALDLLVSKKFLQWRRNPKMPLDQTRQYLVEQETVQSAIDALSPIVVKPTMQSLIYDNATLESQQSLSENQQCNDEIPTSNTNDYSTEITNRDYDTEREEVADATSPAQIHISEVSQDDEEDTRKRRAFMAKVHKIVAQANNGTRPPATKVTIPKRPTQKPIMMEPVIPEKALVILDRWDSIHGKPAPRTPKAIQAAQLLTVCDPSAEDLKKCQDWLYTTDRPGKPWYRSHGVHLPDIAENIGKWQSLQEAPPQKSASNGHSPPGNNGKMDYNAAIMDTEQNFIKGTEEELAEVERQLAERKKARMEAKR